MRVGYARVSGKDQQIDAQLARLAECERLFGEHHSTRKRARPQLEACLTFVREGDVLVVTRLDRLARSVSHLCEITALLASKGVSLVVLDQAIDTTTPTGRLLFHVLAAIAEFELDIRRDAQRAGIEHARSSGRYKGRSPKLAADEAIELVEGYDRGVDAGTLARRYKLSKRSVRRYVARVRALPGVSPPFPAVPGTPG